MRSKIFISTILIAGVVFYSSTLHAFSTPGFQHSVHRSNAGPVFQFKIIQGTSTTWGYDILKDNAIFIHQPNIPGLPGTDGFKTKKDATKVAQLVLGKIKKGEIPPTVTMEALRALKVVK